MLRIGLSGGIGSGKSTVAERFSELGATIIDADQLARDVVRPGSEGLRRIAERFGEEVLDDSGALNRAALGAVVFADESARRDLESITHPLIAERTAALVAEAPHDAIVIHDVPLLVEKDYGPRYHLVVIVDADEKTRVNRLMQARGMTEADVRSRMSAQATDEQRRAAADVWVDNCGTREQVRLQVDRLWRERLVPFEQNVRDAVRAVRPEQLALVDADPDWPAQAARLLGRLRLAFGDTLVTADHVGSTAIPGMKAKDVIDLQIGVTSLRAADANEVRARLDAAGFPRADGVFDDFDREAQGTWPKRMHGNADPGRIAHIHVREVGSPGWRWALMFRDWMRHDEPAAAEYAAEKERILATGVSTSEYAEAKEPWFDAMASRGEEWVLQTGWEPRGGR